VRIKFNLRKRVLHGSIYEKIQYRNKIRNIDVQSSSSATLLHMSLILSSDIP